MRPKWHKCDTCYFFPDKENGINACFCESKPKTVHPEHFCNDWTCARCHQRWDDWHLAEDHETVIFTDHSKCQEAQFG